MSKIKETEVTIIDAENNNDITEIKVDLEKIEKYEEQVIESVESAINSEANLSKEDSINEDNRVCLSKDDSKYDTKYYKQNISVVTPDKLALEPNIACLVSIIIVGLGQMINGQLEKGLLLLFGGMVAVLVISFITCGIGVVIYPLLIVISALDAYNCAKRMQIGESLGKYEFHIFD